jgi:biotin transport system permease protein
MTPGLYLHRQSPVHALPAGAKLAGLAGLAVLLLAMPDIRVTAAVAALTGLAVRLARLPLLALARHLAAPLAVLAVFFTAQALLAGLDVWAGLEAAARFGVLVVAASLVTMTTRVSDMMDAFESAFGLLRPLGVDPGRLALMLALTIRLVPLLAVQVRDIRMAQHARGLDASPSALFVPLMVKTMRLADAMTEALDARGYDPDGPSPPSPASPPSDQPPSDQQ